MAVDPLGRFVYMANINNTVSACRIGESGAVTLVPGSLFLAGSYPAGGREGIAARVCHVDEPARAVQCCILGPDFMFKRFFPGQ